MSDYHVDVGETWIIRKYVCVYHICFLLLPARWEQSQLYIMKGRRRAISTFHGPLHSQCQALASNGPFGKLTNLPTTTMITQTFSHSFQDGAGGGEGGGGGGPYRERGNADMELLEQNDKLMELILDISNELDINVLCHKILVNVCRLTKADRSSLFLARGPRGRRYLEAKLFDVKVDTSKRCQSRSVKYTSIQSTTYISRSGRGPEQGGQRVHFYSVWCRHLRPCG